MSPNVSICYIFQMQYFCRILFNTFMVKLCVIIFTLLYMLEIEQNTLTYILLSAYKLKFKNINPT